MAKTLNEALLAFQGLAVSAKKDGKNPHFRSNYATLESVISAVGQAQQFGICFTQEIDFEVIDGSLVQYVRTVIIHAPSGETRISRTPIKTKDDTDAQKMGSGISYAKRYGLQSIFGIPSEDDDGNAATQNRPAQPPKAQVKSPEVVSSPSPASGATTPRLSEQIASASSQKELMELYTASKATIESMDAAIKAQALAAFSNRKAELKG